jgi:hypothetical protein
LCLGVKATLIDLLKGRVPDLTDNATRNTIILLTSRSDRNLVEPLGKGRSALGLTRHAEVEGLQGPEHEPGLEGTHHRAKVGSVDVELESV